MTKIVKNIYCLIFKKSFFQIFLLFIAIGGYIYYETAVSKNISNKFYLASKKYIAAVFIIFIGFIAHRVINIVVEWYRKNFTERTESRLDDELLPIIQRTLLLGVWVVVLLVILPFFGINISALIALLGVSSLTIALAAQDTIANIISGFLIMIDRPFRVRDRIKLPSGEVVEVLDVGVRRSRFLAEDKSIIIVPNLELSKSKIVNYTYGEADDK